MRVGILAYEGCVSSGVSGFADVLAVADELAGEQRFAVRVLSGDGQPVRPFAGPMLEVDCGIGDSDVDCGSGEWDIVYVPPAFGRTEPSSALSRWVGRVHAGGAIACAACAGVFFLAEAGLLEGRVATTHWGLADAFTSRYPGVVLDPGRMLVDGGQYVCAGGVTAFYDLALHLVARFVSPEHAACCARTLLLDPGRIRQTPYMSLVGGPGGNDSLVTRAQEWLLAHHAGPVSLGELARAVQSGERTLSRRFKRATGRTPGQYLRAVRVEHAKRLLESSDLGVDEIVAAVGYGDRAAFSRVFKDLTGLTQGEYRQRLAIRLLGERWEEREGERAYSGLR